MIKGDIERNTASADIYLEAIVGKRVSIHTQTEATDHDLFVP
jgi:hypothetical protein